MIKQKDMELEQETQSAVLEERDLFLALGEARTKGLGSCLDGTDNMRLNEAIMYYEERQVLSWPIRGR